MPHLGGAVKPASHRRQAGEGAKPRDIKVLLAAEIIARFHDEQAAQQALHNFLARFQKGAMPDEMPEKSLAVSEPSLGIAAVLCQAGLVQSNAEAMRMIKQNAVKIDGERITDRSLQCMAGETHIYQVGKRRFARVTLESSG